MKNKVINAMNGVCSCEERCTEVVSSKDQDLYIHCSYIESNKLVNMVNKKLSTSRIKGFAINAGTLCFKSL